MAQSCLSTIVSKLRTYTLCDILKQGNMHLPLYLLGFGGISLEFKKKMSKNADLLSTGYRQDGSGRLIIAQNKRISLFRRLISRNHI